MRLKRFMSLVLAMALALSLVTVASAANDVLFYDDFSSYTEGVYATSGFVKKGANGKSWIQVLNLEDFAGGYYDLAAGGWLHPDGQAEITKNGAGSKAILLTKTGTNNFELGYMLPTGINLADEAYKDKTIVVSYEMDYGANSAATSKDQYARLIWADTNKTVAQPMNTFALNKPADGKRTIGVYNAYEGAGAQLNNELADTAPNTTYNMAVGVSRGSDINATGKIETGAEKNAYQHMFKKTFGINGSGNFDKENLGNVGTSVETKFISGQTVFHGISFYARRDAQLKISNIKIYTIDTDSFAVSASKTSNLSANETITFNFTNPVSEAAFKANKAGITVKEGDDEFTGFEVGDLVTTVANGQINSSVTISFEGLKDSETYTVEFPAGITNEIAQPLKNSTVTLATVVPDLKVGNFTVISGWGSDDEAVADSFTAAATLQGGKLTIANNTSENLDVAVIYAVYSHNGQLADMVYVQDVLKANGTSEIQAGVTLSENLTEGASTGKVKAFIWNTIDALKPYLGATERNILAAQ